jgi:hypothetical protein
MDKKEYYDIVPNNVSKTKQYIKDKLKWSWEKMKIFLVLIFLS